MKKNILKNNIYAFVISIIISFIMIFVLNKLALPYFRDYTNMEIRRICIDVLRTAGLNELNDMIRNTKYYDIVKDKDGKIESIDIDATVANEAMLIIAKHIRPKLKEIEKGENLPEELFYNSSIVKNKSGIIFEVPFGIIYNNLFFTNIGPKIPVKIKFLGNVGLDVKSRIKEYGINSALIEIYIKVNVTLKSYIPFNNKKINIESEIPVIMKVIKGDTPNYISGIKNK